MKYLMSLTLKCQTGHTLVHLTLDVTFAKFNCEIKKRVSGSVALLFSFY